MQICTQEYITSRQRVVHLHPLKSTSETSHKYAEIQDPSDLVYKLHTLLIVTNEFH